MQLGQKTLAIIIITLVVLAGVTYVASQGILVSSYADAENHGMAATVETAQREINYDIVSLMMTTDDYATWDDTYTFIEDRNPGYIESNMDNVTLENLRLNFVLYLNASGGLVYGKAIDPGSDNEVPLPGGLMDNLQTGSPLIDVHNDGFRGVLLLPSGPMLIAGSRILKSDGTGTARGTLITGRYLDEREISILANITGMRMTVLPYNAQNSTPGLADHGVVVQPVDANTIVGYGLLKDIYGNPALVIRVENPRFLYQQGQASVQYFMVAFLLSGLVLILVTVFLLHYLVISRISRLGNSVRKIGSDNDLSVRLPEGGGDELSQFTRTMNSTLDALQHSQQSLRESGQRFRSLVESISDVFWEVNERLEITYVSPNVLEMFGRSAEEITGKPLLGFMRPEDGIGFDPIARELLATKLPLPLVDMTMMRKDGSLVDLEVSGTPILDPAGNLTGYRGIARDIGERKAVDKALRKWADTFQYTRMAVAICDPDTMRLELCNPAFAGLYGYTMEELQGLDVEDIVAPECLTSISDHVRMAANEGHYTFENVHIRKDRTRFPVLVDITVVKGNDGNIVYQIVNAQDITERKRAEETLRRSEEEFRVLAESSPAAIFFHSGEKLLYVNPAAEEITGYTRDELLGMYFWDFIAPEYREIVRGRGVARLQGERLPARYESRIITRQGAERWIGLTSTRTEFRGQMAILALVQDITERKKAEEARQQINDELESRVRQRTAELASAVTALQESESKYRELVQNANSIIIRIDMKGNILYFNEFSCSFFGYGHDEIIGQNVLDTIVPRTESSGRDLEALMQRTLAHPDRYGRGENENLRRDGSRVWISWTNKALRDREGRVEGILAIGNDITELKKTSEELKHANDNLESRVQQRTAELASAVTALEVEIAERKRMEEQLISSLGEKEVLLKEIHHRVKNNLQIISSLLSLQTETINHENAAVSFRESQDRIKSMALIHEKLYQARDISRIDFGEYVTSLAAYLTRSYRINPKVNVVIDIKDVSLGIDPAISCGLIINELFSNSLKYAFRDGRSGEIRISITHQESAYTLTVSDDGTGLPAGLDFRNTTSLGLQLVNTLVGQLEGNIELAGGTGTTFKITFLEIE